MKHYKNTENKVYAFNTNAEMVAICKHKGWQEMAPISDEEAQAIANPPPTTEQLTDQARSQRDSLIAQSDWTQLDDSPFKGNQAWLDYRQALRDITTQSGYPTDINWPVKP